MGIELTEELLKALALTIDARDEGRRGHPAGSGAKSRARAIADKEAMRRFLTEGSFVGALLVGTAAYERELTYFSPLTLVREPEVEQSDSSGTLSHARQAWS